MQGICDQKKIKPYSLFDYFLNNRKGMLWLGMVLRQEKNI